MFILDIVFKNHQILAPSSKMSLQFMIVFNQQLLTRMFISIPLHQFLSSSTLFWIVNAECALLIKIETTTTNECRRIKAKRSIEEFDGKENRNGNKDQRIEWVSEFVSANFFIFENNQIHEWNGYHFHYTFKWDWFLFEF